MELEQEQELEREQELEQEQEREQEQELFTLTSDIGERNEENSANSRS